MLDSCYLTPAVLDILSHSVRSSFSLHDLSLRGNEFAKKAFLPISSMIDMSLDPPNIDNCNGLVSLDLSGNDLRSGIRLLAKGIIHNTQLQTLVLQNCHLDSPALVPLAEALVGVRLFALCRYIQQRIYSFILLGLQKQNTVLKKVDLSGNPLNSPHQDGVSV